MARNSKKKKKKSRRLPKQQEFNTPVAESLFAALDPLVAKDAQDIISALSPDEEANLGHLTGDTRKVANHVVDVLRSLNGDAQKSVIASLKEKFLPEQAKKAEFDPAREKSQFKLATKELHARKMDIRRVRIMRQEEDPLLRDDGIASISEAASKLSPDDFHHYINWLVHAPVREIIGLMEGACEDLPSIDAVSSSKEAHAATFKASQKFVKLAVDSFRGSLESSDIVSVDNTDIAFFVGNIPVNLAHLPNPQPVFPVFELVCKNAIPDMPAHLQLDVTGNAAAKIGEPVSIMLLDPEAEAADSIFYNGTMKFSEELQVFHALRKIWGYFYLRVSHDPKRFDLLQRREKVIPDKMFYPSPGVYYRDYQVFDSGSSTVKSSGLVKDLVSRIHLAAEETVDNAIKYGEKKLINEVIKGTDFTKSSDIKRALTGPLTKIGGPLPWKVQQEVDFRTNKKRMIKNYYRIMDELLRTSNEDKASEASKETARIIWAKMRNARQYEFTTESFRRVDSGCEQLALQDILGSEYADAEELYSSIPDEDFVEFASDLLKDLGLAGENVPFPERLPFDNCYFGWGPGVHLRGKTLSFLGAGASLSHYDDCGKWDEVLLLGQLVSHDGHVVNFYDVHFESGAVRLLYVFSSGAEKGWVNGGNLDPWRITFLVGEILSHATVIEQQEHTASDLKKYARMVRKAKAPGKPIPPDYYTVYVRDRMIKQRLKKAVMGVGATQSYRHDVEGHPRLLYYHGALPIPEDTHKKLTKREYTFYKYGDIIPVDILDLIMSRGREIPKRGEWVAVRKTFIEPHISPKNPDLPYVPAIRKTTKGMTSARYKEEDEPDRPSH